MNLNDYNLNSIKTTTKKPNNVVVAQVNWVKFNIISGSKCQAVNSKASFTFSLNSSLCLIIKPKFRSLCQHFFVIVRKKFNVPTCSTNIFERRKTIWVIKLHNYGCVCCFYHKSFDVNEQHFFS